MRAYRNERGNTVIELEGREASQIGIIVNNGVRVFGVQKKEFPLPYIEALAFYQQLGQIMSSLNFYGPRATEDNPVACSFEQAVKGLIEHPQLNGIDRPTLAFIRDQYREKKKSVEKK